MLRTLRCGTRPGQSGRQIRVAKVGGHGRRNIQRSFNRGPRRQRVCGQARLRRGSTCANSRTLVSARLRRFAGDGSFAFTVVRGRSPSAIERVVEVSGDVLRTPSRTISTISWWWRRVSIR